MKFRGTHILKYWKYVFFIVLFLGLNYILLYLAYDNIKREMIDNLNARQMIHAKQAAIGIETFFRTNTELLEQLAKNEHIIKFDKKGMELMQEFHASHREIKIIHRIDKDGRIVYSAPFERDTIHQPVTRIQESLQTRETRHAWVSDVFTNRRGFKSIVINVPIIKDGSFEGTLSILFRVSGIISRYVQDIKIGQDGYAWVVSQSGIEISCPVAGHVGNSVFTNCKDFPDIIAMAKRMVRGESGVTAYHFNSIRGKTVSSVKKHAVFMPINLGNTIWSIVVATPEDEVIGALEAFRNKLILIAFLLIPGIAGLIYLLFRNSLLIEEIDRRKTAEEKLRLQGLVLDQIEDRVTVTDLSGNITYINEAEAASLGHSREELIGRSVEVFGDDAKKGATQEEIIKETLGHGSWRGEVVNYSKDGREIVVDCRTVLVRDIAGIPIAMAGVATDITLRKQTEAALRQSEATLRSIFKVAPVGLTIMKDRVFQSVNKAYCDIVGYSEADLIGQTPRALYDDEAEYEHTGQELYFNLIKSGFATIQTKHRRKNGEIRDIILTSVLLQPKTSSLKTVVAVEDITDRMQTEKALRDNRKHLADIIDFLPDATLVIDKNGKVITWNRAIEALTGVKKEDMIGKGNYEYAIPFYGHRRPGLIDYALHPDQEMEEQYTAVQRTGDILFGEAFTLNLPPGDIHISGTASVLRDDNGEIIGAIECIRDNTERKRLEERLQRAEKMEALGTLAGGVAHDLNNVLGIMVGYSELLLEKMPKDSQQKKYADHILQSSVKGAAIIQDLLTLARRGVTVSDVVNLNEIILSYFRSPEFEKLRSDHPSVKISTDLEKGLLNLKGSSVHLGKMVMNLVSNAFESIKGPGDVVIRTENRYLDRPIRGYDEMREGDYLVLTVSDSGSGISPNDLGKIFEPFYTKKVMGRSGTGLGLAVVWGTVKDHHGYIDVQSEEGKGSTFTLYFPVTREEPVKIDSAASPNAYMGKGESILVVDDVKEQRELATSMLAWLGYHVETVSGGEEAIEYLRRKKADLVVLDMIMDPGIDGLETYEKILEIAPGQKAIIVSGFSETDRVRKAQEMGAGTFVRKPYILEKIGFAVRQELDRK